MKTRNLGIAAVVALACLGAAPRVRVVDGKAVVAGPAFTPIELVTVSRLRFYRCSVAKTGAGCTVIAGHMVSHFPSQIFDVTIEVTLSRMYDANTEFMGSGRTTIVQPQPGKRVPFTIMAPRCMFTDGGGALPRTGYTIAVTVKFHEAARE